MPNILLNMLPAIIGLGKEAFTKDNITDSPTTALAALGTTGGIAGLAMYGSVEEAIVSGIITGLSIMMFFLNERRL